jgi:hypothetical protein
VVGAAAALQELLADRVRVLGADHPNTLTTRSNLAYWQEQARVGASPGPDGGVPETLDSEAPGPPPETPSTGRPETRPETGG